MINVKTIAADEFRKLDVFYNHTIHINLPMSNLLEWLIRSFNCHEYNISSPIHKCMYVCMYLRMYLSIYVCIYECMYTCMYLQ